MKALSCAVLLAVAGGAYAQPHLVVTDGTKFDFGTINRGTVVERALTIRNTGTDTLVIGRLEASCGCTGALTSADHVPPGKTSEIRITFNSKNFRGPVHKTVTINSNAEGAARTVVEFTASIVEEVSVNPQQFFFQNAEVGMSSKQTVTVSNQGSSDLVLSGYSSHLEGLSLMLPQGPIKPGTSADVVAEFKPKAAQRVISDAVTIQTNNPNQPEVLLYVYGNAKSFSMENEQKGH